MKTNLNYFLIIVACLCLLSCKKKSTDDNNTPDVYAPPLTIISKTIETGDAYEHSIYPYCFFSKMKDSSYTMVYNNAVNSDNCFHIVNYSYQGILNWHKQYDFQYVRCISFDTSSDGGYLIHLCNQMYIYGENWSMVMKLNQQGDSLWTRNFTDRKFGNAKALSNGEVCLASFKNEKPYTLFLNSNGDSLRSAYIADTIDSICRYECIDSRLTADNEMIFFINYEKFVTIMDPIGTPRICMIKTDYMGNAIWERQAPYSFSDMNINNDGSMLCSNGYIFNLSPTGDITNIISVPSNKGAVVKMDDGSYLVGSSKLFKVDASGNVLWSQNFLPDMNSKTIYCHKLINNHDNTYTMFGYIGGGDYWTAIVIRFRIG